MADWLGLGAFTAKGMGSIPVRELRSHKLGSAAKNNNNNKKCAYLKLAINFLFLKNQSYSSKLK